MEKEDLLVRKKFSRRRGHSEYVLTRKGAALRKIVEAMRVYGKKYL